MWAWLVGEAWPAMKQGRLIILHLPTSDDKDLQTLTRRPCWRRHRYLPISQGPAICSLIPQSKRGSLRGDSSVVRQDPKSSQFHTLGRKCKGSCVRGGGIDLPQKDKRRNSLVAAAVASAKEMNYWRRWLRTRCEGEQEYFGTYDLKWRPGINNSCPLI